MIGALRGQVMVYNPPLLLLDVQGVVYELMVPLTWQAQGEDNLVWVHTQLREDALQLFGFESSAQKQLFRLLVRVNGVGPKMALAILSACTQEELAHAVEQRNAKLLTKIPGVGLKTAERLIVELNGRLVQTEQPLSSAAQQHGLREDAVSALCALGYSQAQAEKVIKQHWQADLSLDQLLRLALRSLV